MYEDIYWWVIFFSDLSIAVSFYLSDTGFLYWVDKDLLYYFRSRKNGNKKM